VLGGERKTSPSTRRIHRSCGRVSHRINENQFDLLSDRDEALRKVMVSAGGRHSEVPARVVGRMPQAFAMIRSVSPIMDSSAQKRPRP